jgi:hypothetical protein
MKTIFYKLDRFFLGNWNIAVLDLRTGRWVLHPTVRLISYLKAENSGGRHILIQPAPRIQSSFLLADDLTWSGPSAAHGSQPTLQARETGRGNIARQLPGMDTLFEASFPGGKTILAP